MARVDRNGLQIEEILADFLEQEALPGTGVSAHAFWQGFSDIIHDLAPRNRELLQIREEMQAKVNAWHIERRGSPHDPDAYKDFLSEIGYLVPRGEAFEIDTSNVDPEIAEVPGPQLVVPIMNARYALNAANARWGSLYDALYGTDALGDLPPGGGYDKGRGARVIARARVFLDTAFPLSGASHADAKTYVIEGGALLVNGKPLRDPSQLAGYRGDPAKPDAILAPKVIDGGDIDRLNDALSRAGAPDDLDLWVMIEMPKAIFNIKDIAEAVGRTRLKAFVMGTNDLAKELRAVNDPPQRTAFQTALQLSVTAARAYDLVAIDGVFNGIGDDEGLAAECRQGRLLGFDGKTLIHPSQLAITNEVFSPAPEDVAQAEAVIEAFADPANAGKGVLKVNGKMTELLHLEEAHRTVDIAKSIAALAD